MEDAHLYDVVIHEQINGLIAFAKKPEGQEALEMIKAARIAELYFEEFSRLGRNA